MKFIRKLYDWFGTKVHSKYSYWWLVGLTFLESSVLLIPIDPLMILFCVEKPKKSIFYATITTMASVAGGIFGYFIGAVLWNTIGAFFLKFIVSPAVFEAVRLKYLIYQNWAVVIAGFTPIPYKAVTLSAGFCKLPIVPFIFYSTLARGARFFLVGGSIYIWGKQIKDFIDKYFNLLVVVFMLLLIGSAMLIK